MSLVARLLLLIALALLPGITVQLYTEYRLREARSEEVLETARRLATQAGATYGRLADSTRQILATLSLLPAIQSEDSAACDRLLGDLHWQLPDFESIGVVDATGQLRCGSDRAARSDAALPYFRRALAARDFASALRPSAGKPADLLQFGYPVYASDTPSGVAYAEMSLRRLANTLRDAQPLPPGAVLLLFDAVGTVLMRLPDDPSYVGARLAVADFARISAMPVGTLTARGIDNRERIFGYVPLHLSGEERLVLAVGLDRVTAFAEYRNATRNALLLIALGSLAALAVAWIAAHWSLLVPLRRLVGAAKHWASGDYTYRLALREERSDLGRLGFSLNQMAGTCEDLLRRKDLLFKEINHRIFNSLQILSSALSLHRTRLTTTEARDQNDRIRQRVVSTGLILRRIYGADQLEEVHLDRFLNGLCGDVARALLPAHMRDRLRIRAVDAVVPIDWIVPLSSIVVELVLALARRLRADSDSRLIDLNLLSNPDMSLQLAISAAGAFSEEMRPDDGSLRAEIVRLLLDQLGGSLETQRGADWLRITMHLPRPPRPAARPAL